MGSSRYSIQRVRRRRHALNGVGGGGASSRRRVVLEWVLTHCGGWRENASALDRMALTVQSIRRVLKGVRYFFMALVFLSFAYFVFTMVSLGGAGTIDVLSEVPVYLSER